MPRGNLEAPNLDDRTWREIVDQAKALIPRYAPEWTDHNPSDLGITLIELFAWITESMTYRLNRVPEKNYVAFLNLLGITRDPATPASTLVTYRLVPGSAAIDLPAGHHVGTPQTEAEDAVVFETDDPVRLLPINLSKALYLAATDQGPRRDDVTAEYTLDAGASPVRMLRAADATASIPDPHSRLIVLPGTVSGMPASNSAMRATLRLSSPDWLAHP